MAGPSVANLPEVLPHREACVLTGHEGAVLSVRFNSAGTYCMSTGKDRTIRLWNPHKALLIKTYTGHGYEVRNVDISKDNKSFTSCGGDKQVFLWDVASGRFLRKFRGHDGTVNAVRFAAEDQVVVSAGYDQAVRIWDCRSRSIEAIQSMRVFQDSVTSLAVAKHEIIAGSVDGTVRRFDIRIGRAYTDQLHHAVTCVALSSDGLCVLAACLDSTVRLLDKAGGDLLGSYEGHVHESVQMDAAFTPSDAYVVGCSEDGSVCYWDLVEATMVRTFKAHTGPVCSLSVHPEGNLLLTSSIDGTVKAWQ